LRLGVTGALPRSLGELTPSAIARVREMGFSGTTLPAAESPAEISDRRAGEVGRMFADAGLDLVEYGRYGTNLVEPDDAGRREQIEGLRQALRVARAAGCRTVIAGAGSLNPRGAWLPHPENRAPATLDRLIASLREAARAAEDAGVPLGLECHTVTPLWDAATTGRVLDAVGSAWLKVHLDPVNWITFGSVYRTGEATRAMVETLGRERLLGAHSKGLALEERLIVHMNETRTGAPDDLFDHAALLREAAAMPLDFYVVLEHLSLDQMAPAREHLERVAREAGLSFER
jgi:sugar phosphate isomerase/epimerase